MPPGHAPLIRCPLIRERPPRPAPHAMPRMAPDTTRPERAESRLGHDFSRIRVHLSPLAGYLTDEEEPAPETLLVGIGSNVLLGQVGPDAGAGPDAGPGP